MILVNVEFLAPGAGGWLDAEMLLLGLRVHLLISIAIYLSLDAPFLIWGKNGNHSPFSAPILTKENSLLCKEKEKFYNVSPLLRSHCRELDPPWEIDA